MCCVIVLILLIAVYSRSCTAAVIAGLRLCGSAVIPALFPMFVGTKLLTGLLKELQLPKGFLRLWQRLFGVSGVCSYGFLFGLLGGYPLGAAVISELYGGKSISKEDAEQSLRFCNNSGPGFFLAALGVTVLHSAKAGILLYIIHIISALLVGMLTAGKGSTSITTVRVLPESRSFGSRFIEAVQSSCAALLQICGLILFFSVFGALMQSLGFFQLLHYLPRFVTLREAEAIFRGLLEMSSGIFSLQDCPNAFVLAAFFMGWGGLCVHFQAAALWQQVGLSPKGYYSAKLLQGCLSAGMAWLLQYASQPLAIGICIALPGILLILRFFRNYTGNPGKYAL